jgi:hypothetical protein
MKRNKTSSREVKTAENKGSNTELTLLPFGIQTQYRAYVFVRLKKGKKCVRPVIYGFGTDACKAAIEAFDRVRNKLTQEKYNGAALISKSEKGGLLQR